jgi:fatty acid desaturase
MYLPIYDEAHHLLAHTHLQFLDASLQLTRATTEAGIAPCTVTPHLSSLAFIALAYAINPKPGTLDPQPSTLLLCLLQYAALLLASSIRHHECTHAEKAREVDA